MHAHAREVATLTLVNGLIEDAAEARRTLQAGMRGMADKTQVASAQAVITALEKLDKVARLDAGTPTEITESRAVADIDAELNRIADEVEARR